MPWVTAQDVVTYAAVELGLATNTSSVGSDVSASDDQNISLLYYLCDRAGSELVDEHDWSHLRQEWSIQTGRQTWPAYLLPADWRNMVDQSGWNRTTRLPLGGPLSEQEWSFLSARLTGVVFQALFRPMQGLMYLYPQTGLTSGQIITMAYKSSYWVLPAGTEKPPTYVPTATAYAVNDFVRVNNAASPFAVNIYRCVSPGTSNNELPASGAIGTSGVINTTDATAPQWNWVGYLATSNSGSTFSFGLKPYLSGTAAAGDYLLFEPRLLISKLKMLWLQTKGFDSAQAEKDYAKVLAQNIANDVAAPKLNLSRPGMTVDRMLGDYNIPITGFGS